MSDLTATVISPLVEIDFTTLGIELSTLSIKEHAFMGHINIRGSIENAKFKRASQQVLGTDLPTDSNTFVEKGDNTILWLGPNEWLVITPEAMLSELVEKLDAALGNTFSAVNDISGGNTIIELSGDKAQALLLKGCPLDLHHSMFTIGQCAQTVIAKTSMTLWQIDSAPVYRLIVRRSFADYLGLWLLDAAKEYRS